MSESSPQPNPHPDDNGDLTARPAVPGHRFRWKVWQVLQVVQARLRFIVLLVLLGVVFSSWGTLSNYWEKWTRVTAPEPAASPDVEYFCPMHPTVIRDHPGEKCPICHMDLARRKKGTGQGEPLPAGTVSRVQLTPYRQVQAGVQTAEVRYLELAKDITTFGTIEFDETKQAHIPAIQKGRIVKQYVNYTGQTVDKGEKLAVLDIRYSPELTNTLDDLLRARQGGNRELERMARQRLRVWDLSDEQVDEFLRTGKVSTQLTILSPIKGHVIKKFQREGEFVEEGMSLYDVADLDTVWIEAQVYEADQPLVHEGQKVVATTLARPNEPFDGVVSFIYPHLDEATRTLTVRMELPSYGHRLRPGDYATVKIHVPPRAIAAFSQALAEEWAKGSAVDALARALGAPAGPLPAPRLRPTLDAAAGQAQLQRGLVLAVPDSAVIDTGSLKVVYRVDEAAPDTFLGVAVQLGPRLAEPGSTTAFYPVLRGLQACDRVVTNGSFLVDADTRLNPAAGSVYYGGSGSSGGQGAVAVRPSTPEDEDARDRKARSALAKLNAEDRKVAEAQQTCAVRGTRLGSMGVPVKVVLDGQPVFLCCSGCEDDARADPRKTLARCEEARAKASRPAAATPAPEAASAADATIRVNLAKLSPEDRALAEAQKFCPVQQDTRLGEMGVPVKLTLQGQTVFVCCRSCRKEAESAPEKTLAKVKELRHRHE
jgi:Cu(I)/Ag(I) efflux system membrane fusion protein